MKLKVTLFVIIGIFALITNAYSAVYHIDPSASRGGNGSAASPFNEWSDLPAMRMGDDVYFKCGTWLSPSSSLRVGWQGTKDDPVVIGSYYLDNTDAVYGLKGARPVISGSNYTVPGGNWYSGLVSVQSADYVHIKNLHIYKAGGTGIKIDGRYTTNSRFFIVDNCVIEGAVMSGIATSRNPENYGRITNNDVSGCAYGWHKGFEGIHTWPVTITVAHCPKAHTIISGNYVHENWGEGIGVWRAQSPSADGSGYVTIEDNVIWNNRRVDIYIDSTSHNIVRRNLCLGANDSMFSSINSGGRPWNQFGIWVNNEIYNGVDFPSNHNSIYNNIVVGHYAGIGISTEAETGTMTGNRFYNNTVIANRSNFTVGNRLSGFRTRDVIFKNNISYCPPGTDCQDVGNDPAWFDGKINADYNAWTRRPSNWSGPNDKITNDSWKRISGWQDLRRIPSIYHFMPKDGNPVLGAGVYLPAPYNEGIIVNKSKYQTSPLNISVKTMQLNKSTNAGSDMGVIFLGDGLTAPTISIVGFDSK